MLTTEFPSHLSHLTFIFCSLCFSFSEMLIVDYYYRVNFYFIYNLIMLQTSYQMFTMAHFIYIDASYLFVTVITYLLQVKLADRWILTPLQLPFDISSWLSLVFLFTWILPSYLDLLQVLFLARLAAARHSLRQFKVPTGTLF